MDANGVQAVSVYHARPAMGRRIIIIIIVVIVTASPLPPTHHGRLRSGDRVRGLEVRGAGSDECLEDCGSWRLDLSYFKRFGATGGWRCGMSGGFWPWGDSIYRGLETLEFEAWSSGGSRFRQPIQTGWVPLNKQTLDLRRLEVTNVSRIVALGGSICRILRGLEAPGGPASNQPVRPGGSA